jgi:peptide/nickel transport system ATP-binding protein
MADPLLKVSDVSVEYASPSGRVRAVDRVSLTVDRGEVLGLAGESGCGKSTLAQAVLRILPPPAVITGGTAIFEGQDLFELDEPALRKVRWKRLSMVFQSALDSLSPVLSLSEQIADTLHAHGFTGSARARASELLKLVDLEPALVDAYPHQLSGGMRQRAGIALALALDPALVLLDEPTTALDVIVEHQILQRLLALKAERGFAMVFITHDLARMLQIADRVAILYAGRLVEVAPAQTLKRDARHPYTRGLLAAFPSLHGSGEPAGIGGAPPSLASPPPGCRFHPRCELAIDLCRTEQPKLVQFGEKHFAACHVAAASRNAFLPPIREEA